MKRYLYVAAALALCTPSAWAQSADDAADENEIIVTAPLEGSRFESLQGAAVLTRDEIAEQLNRGLGDTLDALPGVATTFYGAGASRPIIRGLGEDRVRVLENGIGAIDASSASPDHAVTADSLDAQRIEILRGPAALAFGGNAVGGVVNVIDDSIPASRPDNGFAVQGLGAYSSVDEGWQGDASLTAALTDNFVLSAGISGREAADYKIPDSPTSTAENSWTDALSYSAGGAFIGEWGNIGIAVKRTETDYGLPPEAPGEPGGHIELAQTRYELRGEFRIPTGVFDRIDYAFQTADYEHTEFEGDGAPGTTFTNEGWEGRIEAHHRGLDGQLNGAVGLQALDTDFAAVGEEGFIGPTNTRSIGMFAVERWDAGGWGLEGGARLERTEHDNQDFGGRDFDAASISVGVFARPAQDWFLAATVARTERAPNQFELFADGPHLATANYELGDPTIDKETATSLEFSARYTADAFRAELNLYRIEFDGYVALLDRGDVFWFDEDSGTEGFAPDPGDPAIPSTAEVLPVFSFTPRDAAFTGGEFSLTARLFETAGFTISADGAVDVVRAEIDGGGALPRIPPRSVTLGLSAESDAFDARLEVVDTAEQDRVAQFETPTGGFTFVNARFAFRPDGADGPLTILLDARNLTDELGRAHTSFLKDELPLPGRSLRLAIVARY